MTRETYRWAVVCPKGSILNYTHTTRAGVQWHWASYYHPRMTLDDGWRQLEIEGYRVARFKLVECEEGEGE